MNSQVILSERIIGVAKFFIPIILGLTVYAFIGLLLDGNSRFAYWSLISAYFFPPLGKESVIPTGIGLGFNPLVMALSIAFVDVVVALFLLWNYDLAKKIPIIGRFMEKVEQIGQASSGKYSWIKPLRFIGIILFVMVPFQGSGGMVGTILGRLFGMKPWNTFLGISIGALTGCILIAYFAELIKSVLIQNLLTGIFVIILVILIGIMVFMYIRNQNKKNNNG